MAVIVKKNKTLWPLFKDGIELPQGYRATSRRFSEIPGTHLVDFRRIKG